MARRPDTVVEVSVIVLFYCDLISSELIDCMEVVTLFFSSLWPTRGWRSVEGLLRFSVPVRPVEHRFPRKELVALLVSVTSDR